MKEFQLLGTGETAVSAVSLTRRSYRIAHTLHVEAKWINITE